jgi:imidazolonepropionase-like amidohydrolase
MLTAYTGATLIDGSGGPPLDKAVIVVDDDRITAVGTKATVEIPAGAAIEDVTGKTILPGLIDCHIHLDLHGLADTYTENLVEDNLRTLRAAAEMHDTLRAGFTTVRSVGSVNYIDLAVKQGIALGYARGPRILAAGRIITMTSSGTEYFSGMYREADGPDECRKAAREQLKKGADFLKLMATGAVMNPGSTPGAAELDKEEMQAIVREGLKLGKHTAAHAHGAEGIKNAVAAGVRTIEHGTLADDQALEMIREAGAFLVPTMSPRRLFLKNADQVPPFMVEKSKQMIDQTANLVGRAKAAGVSIAMGTDAGTNFNYHGDNAQEIVTLVEEKMLTPMEALTAATGTAARAIMRDHEVGVLAPGKLADMLIVDQNPLENIRILRDRSKFRVVFGGRPLV